VEGYEQYDEEARRIMERKLAEYQRSVAEARQAEEARRLEEARRQELLRRLLTPRARERLSNLKVVRPELAELLENQIIQLAQAGRIPVPVTDDLLKEILSKITEQQREIKVRFYKRPV